MADEPLIDPVDTSAYIPKGQKEGYAVSRRTHVPITFTEDLPKGEIGEYESGSPRQQGAAHALNFLSLLPSLAASLGPQIKVNPTVAAQHGIPVNEVIGHENIHALEAQEPNVDPTKMAIYSALMPTLTSATGTTDPQELPAYASSPTQGGRIMGPDRQKVIQQYMQLLSPKGAAMYGAISHADKGN